MATFQFSDHREFELDFCGELSFKLPLDEETTKQLKKAGKYLQEKSKPTDDQTLENLCDYVMDAIDDVLGEGAAEKIAALKADFDLWDALDVFQFISDEFDTATKKFADRYKRTPATPTPTNCAQRRAAARASLTAIRGA